MGFLFVFSLGVFSVAWWQQLPDETLYLASLALLAVIFAAVRWLCGPSAWRAALILVLACLWGSGWGVLAANHSLGQLLPEALDGEQLQVTGSIVGLVDSNSQRSRFYFRVDTASSPVTTQKPVNLQLLLLSSYGQPDSASDFIPGDHWQLSVRVRRPRGFVNAGAFDYQRWLMQRGVSATGYVLGAEFNAKVVASEHNHWCKLQDWLSRWRNQVALAIEAAELSNHGGAVLAALTIGDKRGITHLWNHLVRLGIVHLMVVSGLHVGLVAGFGFMLGGLAVSLLTLVSRPLGGVINSSAGMRWLPPLAGLVAAGSYSLLAGFSLPAQRALIAVTVVMVARLCQRQVRPLACIVWALWLIAISQPLAVLSSGFWLSFVAVIILVGWFYPWQLNDLRFGFKRAISAQLALTAGLLVPSLVLVGSASWLGPLVNLLAVPWISLISVPLALLGCLALGFSWHLAEMLWQLADYSIIGLWWLLGLVPEHLGLIATPVPLTPLLASCGLLAALSWLLPRGLVVRLLGSVPLLAYLWAPAMDKGAVMRLTVLDVGQGLAVVLEASDLVLVYDAGPAYGDRFNAGAGIIAPYLRSRGHGSIDQLVISHEDMDHAGGLPGLLQTMPVKKLLHGPGLGLPAPIASVHSMPAEIQVCAAGHSWEWPLQLAEGASEVLYFEILAPDKQQLTGSPVEGNNYSCVLQIRWRDQLILLPGDIERQVETRLLKNRKLSEADILLAPHHGSKTSSTAAFTHVLRPAHVVFSAGYRHQFGHPHKDVQSRYRQVGSRLWNTAEQGALSFVWSQSGALSVEAARVYEPEFWWRPVSVDRTGIMLEFAPAAED
jgi:competence protein ComEC